MEPVAPLPVETALPELRAALAAGSVAVLEAPPGAGKTTLVPLALLDEDVGATVGYRMRLDTRVGPRTRIEVVTEGVLARMIQADPELRSVGAILFDEF